jgi:hypothetical protein
MGKEARAFIRLFPQKHIPAVLSSILQAGESLTKKTANDLEDWLSRRLYRRLIRNYTFRDGPLDIRLQPEIVFLDSDANRAAGKIDLLISCGLGAEVYFAIEAKRLRVRSSQGNLVAGNNKYVNDGMMRFVAGKYAPFMKTGAMLGYVYDGETGKARSGVGKYIQSKAKELKLMSPMELARSPILPNQSIDETHHDLSARTFIIYHIFLAV